jgi:hypothetical protein
MSASLLDGSLAFWHQGLPAAGSKTASVNSGGDVKNWHQGLPSLRLLGASAAQADVLTNASQDPLPPRARIVVAF